MPPPHDFFRKTIVYFSHQTYKFTRPDPASGETMVVMLRLKIGGSDAEVLGESGVARIIRRGWQKLGDRHSVREVLGVGKDYRSPVILDDELARHLQGNACGDDVVGVYPFMYTEAQLAEKGFEVWFLIFAGVAKNEGDKHYGME